MPQTFYEVVWIFLIYAFIGWCTEVSYATLDVGKFVNRGFLNGPYCPIYGIGVLVVVVILTPLKNSLLILFIGSFVLTSVLEYITGYVLEKVFHNKWWDYSDKPFNIKGYVCLKFSILWGLACSFIMLVIHPIVMGFIHIIPKTVGIVLLIILCSAFSADCVVTVSTILKFNKRLKIMGEIAGKLKVISNEIGENIYENVAEAIEKKAQFDGTYEEFKTGFTQKKEKLAENVENRYQKFNDSVQLNIEKKRAEYEELSKRYKELSEKKIDGHDRLIKAFPGMHSIDNEDSLLKLKEHLMQLVKNKKNQEE